MSTERKCRICGRRGAPYGRSFGGLRSQRPAGYRGYIFHCGAPICAAEVEKLLEKAMAKAGWVPPIAPPPLPPLRPARPETRAEPPPPSGTADPKQPKLI